MAVNDPFGNFAQGDKDDGAALAPSATSSTTQPTGASDSGGSTSGGTTSGGASGTVSNKPKYILFKSMDDRVYVTGTKDGVMNYTITDESVELTDVVWNWKTASETAFKELAKAAYKSESNTLPEPFTDFSSKGIAFDLSWFTSNKTAGAALSNDMQLLLEWKKDNVFYSTSSGLFAVIDDRAQNAGNFVDETNSHLKSEMDTNTELAGVEVATATGTSSSSQPTGDNSDTGGAGSSPQASQSASPGSSKSKSGGGGLSTGAKAGIGVGAALGALLLIGALLWFLFRRRRQSKDKTGYKGQQSSNTYMVDKETTGRVTESPTSPYSDDNQGQHVPLTDIETARDAPTTHAPYEDAPPRSSLGSHGDRGTGTHTPQGVSTNVAHLVEDGMTADEIRRLEEEERQLDDEIERAAERGARR